MPKFTVEIEARGLGWSTEWEAGWAEEFRL